MNNFTQSHLGKTLNIHANGYGRIESGEVKIDIEKLSIISKVFKLKSSDLIDLELYEIIKKQTE